MTEEKTIKESLGETLAKHLLHRIELLEAAVGLTATVEYKFCGFCLLPLTSTPKEHWGKCQLHPLRSLPFVIKFIQNNDAGIDSSSHIMDVLLMYADQQRSNDLLLKKVRTILGIEGDEHFRSGIIETLNKLVERVGSDEPKVD